MGMIPLAIENFRASEAYRVKLRCPEVNEVTAFLIAPIMITTQSEWQASGEQPFNKDMEAKAQQLSGGQTLTNSLFTLQSWQGSQPISIQVTVGFMATTDAYSQVWVPMRDLLLFPLPIGAAKGFVKGPVSMDMIGDAMKGGNQGGTGDGEGDGNTGIFSGIGKGSQMCSVQTSNMYIDKLLPCNATPEYNQVLTKDKSGGGGVAYPISGQVSIAFQTHKMMTRQEVRQWFL